MTIRKLLLILFLYILLVWILAAYLHSSDLKELLNFGLLSTAIGIAVLLCAVLIERIYSFLQSRPKQEAPVQAVAGPAVLGEDDLALLSLIKEADQRLAQASGHAGARPAQVQDLPLILAMGPERSGKTAAIQNSGLEPSLLAGQVIGSDGTVAPTRVANLWLAHESLLVEVGGRVFNGDRLTEFLSNLRPAPAAGWKRWLAPPPKPREVRSILLFFDAREFKGTPEPSRLDRWAQSIRSRLSAAAGVFGVECPVYVIFTNTDGIQYFEDYFTVLPEAEAGQVLGVISQSAAAETQGRVWAEAETKRLNQLFQSLFLRLSDRALLTLSLEFDPLRRAASYEFPREFRKIRAPLVQFLVDVFKPDPLNPESRLRGFFFTGTRKVEQSAALPSTTQSVPAAGLTAGTGYYQTPGSDATSMFAAGGMTQVYRVRPKGAAGRLIERWMFSNEFFQKVLSLDRPVIRSIASPSKLDRQRKLGLSVAAGLGILLALLWTISWIGNNAWISEVGALVAALHTGNNELSMTNLEHLDDLRKELVTLQQNFPLYDHWGLSQREDLENSATRAYFARLKQLSLDKINNTLGVDLAQAGSVTQQQGGSSVYDRLKTYRTITVPRACSVDQGLVKQVLTDTVPEAHRGLGESETALLDTQLGYYVTQLAADKDKTLPVSLPEVPTSVENARDYVRRQNGLEQRLRGMLSEIGSQTPALQVPADYRSVMTGPSEFPGQFTKRGETEFLDRVGKGNFGSEERCVMGDSAGKQALQKLDAATAGDQLRSLYYREYANAWRQFLASFQVIPYGTAERAVHNLDILSGAQSPSPLLSIIRMVAENTNFPAPKPGEPSYWDKIGNVAQTLGFSSVSQAQATGKQALSQAEQLQGNDTPMMTRGDVAKLFQPVQVTTPPDSPTLVSDNNQPYVNGLRKLRDAIGDFAGASSADKQAKRAAAEDAKKQAAGAVSALSDRFPDVGKEGLNKVLTKLLNQPIDFVAPPVLPAPDNPVEAVNKAFAQVCSAAEPLGKKYPFNPNAPTSADASKDDLKKLFAPDGAVWSFTKGAGANVVFFNKETQAWETKPDAQGLKPTDGLLRFLNAAQDLRQAFFADGSGPQFKYYIRPVKGSNGVAGIKLLIDGNTPFTPETGFREEFHWPDTSGAGSADARQVYSGGAESGFGRFEGLWAVFRLFQIAEHRDLSAPPKEIKPIMVTWKYSMGTGGAQKQELVPAAQAELLQYPNTYDVLNPEFFKPLSSCPSPAASSN